MGRPMKYVLLTACLITIIIASLYWYAPYVFRILREGYPSSVWPAAGYHALVRGTDNPGNPEDTARTAPVTGEKLVRLMQVSGTRAFAVMHDGKLKAAYYATGYNPETRFNSFSMIKSLVGALIFKAVDEGRLSSLDAPVGSILSEITNPELGRLPVRALLDMRSGIMFEGDELKSASGFNEKDMELTVSNPFGPMARLHYAGLDKILPSLTGQQEFQNTYSYQNVNTALLARLIENLYSQSVADILSTRIWQPAGAEAAYWRQYGKNQPVSAYCCLYAKVTDWIKVAKFIMNNGTEKTRFLEPRLWQTFLGLELDAKSVSTGVYANHVRYDVLDRPGQQVKGAFAYFIGQGGQIVYIMPQHRLVVIRFGKRNQLLHSTLYEVWREIMN